jgi:hypothetical protein
MALEILVVDDYLLHKVATIDLLSLVVLRLLVPKSEGNQKVRGFEWRTKEHGILTY